MRLVTRDTGRSSPIRALVVLFASVLMLSDAGPTQALRAAAAAADPADRIVVFGSFYTVGGVLQDGIPRLQAKLPGS